MVVAAVVLLLLLTVMAMLMAAHLLPGRPQIPWGSFLN